MPPTSDYVTYEWSPRAFMVNAPEREVDLIPDWLKLKMIRSEVPPLVDAALVELDPGKLVLFIQSFGIPVPRYVIPNLLENDMTASQICFRILCCSILL